MFFCFFACLVLFVLLFSLFFEEDRYVALAVLKLYIDQAVLKHKYHFFFGLMKLMTDWQETDTKQICK